MISQEPLGCLGQLRLRCLQHPGSRPGLQVFHQVLESALLVVYPPQPVGSFLGLSRALAIEAFFVGVLVVFFSVLLFQVYRYYLLGEPTDLDRAANRPAETDR